MPEPLSETLKNDVETIGRISAVPAILRTMRASTGLRFTLVARVTDDRWVACAVHDEIAFGLKAGGELDVATTLCSEVRDSHEPILIDKASTDPDFHTHKTPKMYGFESYVAVPIFRRNGEYFGNICGLDPEARNLKDGKTLATLQLFSELISVQIEAEEQHEANRHELDAQRTTSKLRDQFIAVLGHDVRNPLSSIQAGTELILRRTENSGDRRILERVRASSKRITALVDDLLDLARGRLAGGISLAVADADDLVERLRHVVAELQASHPSRVIEMEVASPGALRCDAQRIEQLLSNLLANAVEHGAAGVPIRVAIGGDDQTFSLSVTNGGPPIPADKLGHLFEPYFRGQSGRANGLGLGLYIVSEIAKAHGGNVGVTSTPEGTTFNVAIPRSDHAD